MKLGKYFKTHLTLLRIFGALLGGIASAATAQSNLDYTAVPPLSQQFSNDPMVMLALASDHQLFIRAYNEYDDLDDNGEPDAGYNHNFAYVGYFDNKKCYSYTSEVFTPTATEPTAPEGSLVLQYCPDSEWSGNFLNWLTMTRADIVRLVLYGGYRSTDTATETILERAYLPSDAHSFAKYYSDEADDINKLMASDALAGKAACEGNENICKGYTFCNTSKPVSGNHLSHERISAIQPPWLRVVKGNYSFWGSGERYQCLTRRNNGDVNNPPTSESDGELQPNGIGSQGRNAPDGAQVRGKQIKTTSPKKNEVADFNVRVRVCGENSDGGAHKCKSYGASKKPVGVLQEVGGDGAIKFGLITKGYNTNKSFGVLRKNISSFAEEINEDGTFKVAPVPDLYGNTAGLSESIVGALNALRLVDYRYSYTVYNNWRDTYYRGTYLIPHLADNRWGPANNSSENRYNFIEFPETSNHDCTWGRTAFANGECRNWGNPFSELMAEAYRYLAGAPEAKATALDDDLIPGLKVAPWNPPTRAPAPGASTAQDLSCINMNVLAFNASAVSYDGDELADETTVSLQIGSADDGASIADLTNFIGIQEGISGGSYFVGSVGGSGDQQCTAKTITDLANVRGTCPDAPRLEGSYLVSGLAHFVKTRDMLAHVPGKNTISTFGVKLAGDLPRINIKLGQEPTAEDGGIIIIPACRNETDEGNCALVDFRKLEHDSQTGTDYYFVSWEDSEQGGDYDQDLNGVIGVRVGQTDPSSGARNITVTTQIYQVSTRKEMLFGYVISGVGGDDGLHQTSRVVTTVTYYPNGQEPTENSIFSCNDGAECGDDFAASKDFTFSNNQVAIAGKTLKDPLWYATKWGGFRDSNPVPGGVPVPDRDSEWKGADNNPFGYTLVRNPADLSERLSESFKGLVKRPASGSGAAVSSNTLTGEGLLLQAAYKPEVTSDSEAVSWVGILNGLFFDSFGNIREDSNNNQQLDEADNIIQIYYDASAKDTRVRRMPFRENLAEINTEDVVSDLSLEDIKPVWSARDQLASLTNDQKAVQRGYSSTVERGRFIFTSIDKGTADAPAGDGVTIHGEIVPFVASAFDGTSNEGLGNKNFQLLGVENAAAAGNLVNFIRGVEGIEGFRNRTVNYNGSGRKPWILGDIVHSTPTVVGRPSDGYNVSYSDQTYTAFRNKYLNRRQVAYVGANDGMLHAFNMGVYNEMDRTFAANGHPLGSELWAYVPYNLLPHLKWLSQSDYSHVYYVDSSVKAYDVNIFPSTGEDGRHPYGWGTILVVGMRFGGGEYSLTIEGETDPRVLRSAYMIFDVTDPEDEPTLIAEITDEDMGYTLAEPELVHFRQGKAAGGFLGGDSLQRNDWYLVFGSGPTNIEKGISDKPAKLFYLDLKRARQGQVQLAERAVTEVGVNGHVSAIRAVDWNGDYQDDQLYISVVGDGLNGNLGSLRHASLRFSNVVGDVEPLLTNGVSPVSAPFSAPVLPVRNLETGDFWVFAGTGRLLVSDDLENEESGAYYGIKVSQDGGANFETSVDLDDLYDVSGHSLYEKDVFGATVVKDTEGQELSIAAFQGRIDAKKGWNKTFTRSGESNFVPTSLLRSALLINTYTPGISDCDPLGKSYLYALNAFNGLPDSTLAILPRNTDDTINVGDETYTKIEETYGEEDGVALNVSLIGNDSGIVPNSLGGLSGYNFDGPDTPAVRRSWVEIPLDVLQ